MAIIKSQRRERFTSICNELLNDTTISFKAKGLLCWLMSRPPLWEVSVEHLAKNFIEGKDAIYSMLNELIQAGYVKRNMTRNDLGRLVNVDYLVFENKQDPDPLREIPDKVIPDGEKPDNIKDLNKLNTDLIKEEEKPTPQEVLKNNKIGFCQMILAFDKKHPNKYPKLMYLAFAKYWTETGGVRKIKMRFEDQKFFEISRRLATWFSKAKDPEITSFWEKEQKIQPLNELLKTIF